MAILRKGPGAQIYDARFHSLWSDKEEHRLAKVFSSRKKEKKIKKEKRQLLVRGRQHAPAVHSVLEPFRIREVARGWRACADSVPGDRGGGVKRMKRKRAARRNGPDNKKIRRALSFHRAVKRIYRVQRS
jgi:hypothetical protein